MADINSYYELVQTNGSLRSNLHAKRWSLAVLQTLGLNLSKAAKASLANALPDELSAQLKDVWWLIHFRNTDMSLQEFQERVGRRAGNTDIRFARIPTGAVFGAVQTLVSNSVAREVADSLSPELKALWDTSVVAA
ncbi:MAG: DUF2267 domain-containing protein [Candidatus Promineifilaceae bacterium]